MILLKKWAYYNEVDPFAAQWLRNLIKAGHIASGEVDERSIEDVRPDDVREFVQCHWFAGVAVWSLALRNAGWPDNRPVWTGSCPCQPFSTAGKGAGQKDIRHLWPVWIKLISACQPDIIFGEQVSSALVLGKATNESLQNLRAEFTGSGILQAYRGDSASILQGLSSYSRQGALRGIGQGGDHGKISPVQGNTEDYAAGELPDYRSKTARQEERHTLQLGRSQSGNSRGDKRRGVPVIRDLFQFDGEASMEQPIVGQNNPGTGIYTGECSSSFVFSERHDARLGAGDGSSGNGGVVKKQGVKDDERRTSRAGNAESNEEVGGAWIDLVFSDLEASGYACAAVAFPSSSCGAPHIRDRLYWVADTTDQRLDGRRTSEAGDGRGQARVEPERFCDAGGLEHPRQSASMFSRQTNGFWADADWLLCRDGKWRPVSPKPQPLVDGSSESLGRVRPETIQEIEREINAWSMESQIDRDQALRNLLLHLGAAAQRCWTLGGIPGLHEAPFLLAFLRQLAQQGWGVAQRLPISCKEVAEAGVRGVRLDGEQAGAPRRYGLAEQQAGERADAVPFLSSLLARHALAEWDDAYAAHAEIGFPLAHNARSRVGRLRASGLKSSNRVGRLKGYGNAINAEAARAFIRSYMECL